MSAVDTYRLLLLFEGDLNEDLWWRRDGDNQLHFFVLVNDVFEWGTADAETIHADDLDALGTAIRDCRNHQREEFGPTLWVARKRGARPQGAYYQRVLPPRLHDLFDAAGPARETNILNPHPHP